MTTFRTVICLPFPISQRSLQFVRLSDRFHVSLQSLLWACRLRNPLWKSKLKEQFENFIGKILTILLQNPFPYFPSILWLYHSMLHVNLKIANNKKGTIELKMYLFLLIPTICLDDFCPPAFLPFFTKIIVWFRVSAAKVENWLARRRISEFQCCAIAN